MKKFALSFLVLLSAQAFAANNAFDNAECIRVYRDSYIELRENVELYNGEQINKWEFSASLTAISTDIGLSRGICHFTETPDASTCVEKYKNLYNKLRDRIKLSSVMTGNQPKINYSEQVHVIETKVDQEEDTSLFGRARTFFRGAREAAVQTQQLGELAFIDLKCQSN